MLKIEPVETADQIALAQKLIRGYFSWFFDLIPGSDQDAAFSGWEQELVALPRCYFPPTGCFLLATVDGQAAGCVALIAGDSQAGELKRMFVHPHFRGQRIGVQLVEYLFQEARSFGYKRVILDSHRSMSKAHEIYRNLGFREVEAPSDFPDELKQSVIFMEYALPE
jgi:GNAT superfamily N-acetyltransferase